MSEYFLGKVLDKDLVEGYHFRQIRCSNIVALDNELLEIQKDIFSKEGEKKKAIEIAKSLLDVEIIALKTGLSIEETNNLK
ncbi:MAG: hypothetical protein RSD36_17590 [Terrisporobacter sp.]